MLISLSAIAADEESLGRAAEQAGKPREALGHYITALNQKGEGSSAEQTLREEIIKLVQKLDPPPALPEEAERRMIRGRTALKMANERDAYLRAAEEFQEALKVAPWLAEGYFNLGVVLDKAGRPVEAIRSLKLYMLAAPNASDAKQVQNQIYEIEYRAEQAAQKAAIEKRRAEEAEAERLRKAREFDPSRLAGKWCFEKVTFNCHYLRIVGSRFRIVNDDGFAWASGEITSTAIAGGVFPHPGCPSLQMPLEGTISESGRRIEYDFEDATTIRNCQPVITKKTHDVLIKVD